MLAIFALVGSIVSLCIGTSFAKTLFPHLGAAGTSAWRLGAAAIMLLLIFRPWQRRWTWLDIRALAPYGLILGAMNVLFYEAVARLPLGIAIAIEFIGPLSIALLRSRHGFDVVWVTCAAIGLALILPFGAVESINQLDPAGIVYAAVAGLCWALYIVLGKGVAKDYGRFAAPMGLTIAACFVVPFGFAQSGATLLSWQWVLPGIVVGLLSSAIPYSLEIVALKQMSARAFSIFLSLEPAVGALAGWLMLSEALTAQQMIAIAFIIAACMGSSAKK